MEYDSRQLGVFPPPALLSLKDLKQAPQACADYASDKEVAKVPQIDWDHDDMFLLG